jgi:hypothetical protein
LEDGQTRGVSGHSCGAIVNFRKESQGEEATEKDIMIKTGGGRNEKYVACVISLRRVKLREDRNKEFRDRKRQKERGEVVFPGGLRPGTGMGGGTGSNVEIVEKEESIDD